MNPFEEKTIQQIAGSGETGAETWLIGMQATAQISAARYMLYSVVAIAITSGLNALFAFLIWYAPHSN
jgi:hypothetical protein